MNKKSKVTLIVAIVFFVVIIVAIFLIYKTGYFGSQAASWPIPCPSGCYKHLPIKVTVKYNNAVYTKAPIKITGNSTNCNGPATGSPTCTRACTTSSGSCSLDLCWLNTYVGYQIKGAYSFSNGIKLTTNTLSHVDYGGAPDLTLTATCKNSAGVIVSCP
jgi:hypothetical protein